MNQKETLGSNNTTTTTTKFSSTKDGAFNTPLKKPKKWKLILLGVGVVIVLMILTMAGIYLAVSVV